MNLVPRRLLGGVAVVALVASACSTGASPSAAPQSQAPQPSAASQAPQPSTASQAPQPSAKQVTIEWWHITTGEPGKTQTWQEAADAYVKAHPNVKINVTVLENEAFKSKLNTQIASGKVPDLFQSWGGGTMAAQAKAGALQDITQAVSSWKDEMEPGAMSIYQYQGKQYGIPWDLGMIGFWYNKDLFTQAGISAPPTTWSEFMTNIDKLKAKGGSSWAAYAIAGKDEWPGMHLWTYLVLRVGGAKVMQDMIESGNWNTEACTKGGQLVADLVAKNPFQPGYLSATYDKGEAAAMGNGKAAMELMGQWAPAVQVSNSTSKKGIGDKLAWFPVPTVEGGAGAATDGVGGGNGIAVGKNAPPEAIDFLHYLVSPDVAREVGAGPKLDGKDSMGIPVTKAALDSIKDPLLKQVLDARGKAQFIQLYLDQATSPAMGQAINDATAGLFAKTKTPAQVCQAITTAAAANK